MFDKQKQDILSKLDKSKKGSIDKDIRPLVELINSKDNYYTTSSCAGRILLMAVPDKIKKYNVDWIFLSHDKVSFKKIRQEIAKISTKKTVWFKEESSIIHICCKTLKDANKLIEIAKHLGFKRSGINTISKKTMVELISTENMGTPIIKGGKLLVKDDYIKILVDEANKKLKKTKEKIKKFTQQLDNL